MSKYKEKEEILHLEDMHSLRYMNFTTVTVRIHRWHYHIPRVKLTIIEGYYRTAEEIEKALQEAKYGKKSPNLPEDYPKHLEIVIRPEAMTELAKVLAKISEDAT
jgi:hypothetical protein